MNKINIKYLKDYTAPKHKTKITTIELKFSPQSTRNIHNINSFNIIF